MDERKKYGVEQLHVVTDQVRELAEAARRSGTGREFLATMQEALSAMETNPATWGDPIRHYRRLAWIEYHRLIQRFVFLYAVDESRKIVFLRCVIAVDG